jgi:uncharacterized protein YpmS
MRLVLFGVLFLSLACGPCGLLGGKTPTPPRPIAVSTESAAQLESRIRHALRVSGEPGQQFILRMTDAEVTSLLASKLAQYEDSPVADPQVWFTKGKIYGTGRLVNVVPVTTNLYLVASPRIEDGNVRVVIEEASAGGLPLPESVLQTLSQSLNETVAELQLEVDVNALEILEGEAIIKGMRR